MSAPAETEPDAVEMKAALGAIGVTWETDEWIVTGLESGPEPADTCEAAIRRMMGAAEYDGARDERKRISERLSDHYLVEVRCDHDRKTDVAICSCALWASERHNSVGEAVEAWIAHACS